MRTADYEHTHKLRVLAERRDAALAELDDPMLRLIAAAKKVDHGHLGSTNPAIYTSWHRPSAATITGCQRCQEYVDLRDAIDYAEQRRAQG
ncbi:MAG: hypothetical protein WC054_12065 [Candidatus Nanopelagicales bacterium]